MKNIIEMLQRRISGLENDLKDAQCRETQAQTYLHDAVINVNSVGFKLAELKKELNQLLKLQKGKKK